MKHHLALRITAEMRGRVLRAAMARASRMATPRELAHSADEDADKTRETTPSPQSK
jgi:hypothetical protein